MTTEAEKTLSSIAARFLAGIVLLTGLHSSMAQTAALEGFDCLIEPHAVVMVGTREQGVLESLAVDRGDIIEKGQVLAELESGVERLAVELAKARADMRANIEAHQVNVAYLARTLKNVDELYKKKALPFQEKDKAATDLALARLQLRESREEMRLAELELERAKEALSRRTIRSPIDGVAMERLLSPGELVDERPIVKVAQIVPLNVEVIMPVEHYNAVKLGMRADIRPLVPDAGVHSATVTAVDPVVDAASNTFGVRLELPNVDRAVPGGIRCDVSFKRD